jgi:DNA-binding NtrC family response regulator
MTHYAWFCSDCGLVRDLDSHARCAFCGSGSVTSASRVTAAAVSVDMEDLNLIRASLAADGVEVIQTSGLEEAIRTPTLVILLDADGHRSWANSLRHVVEVRPAARVVVLARKADNRMWAEALSQGAHDLLQKPLLPSEVRSAVLGALQRDMHRSAGA